jgi:hypothetical protein
VTSANEVQDIPLQKLHEFFGADAAVYLKVKRYGTSYAIVSSETRVTVEGHIVDLRTGETLWQGAATASSAEQQQQSQGGLAALLITALVKQIVSTSVDDSYRYAGVASYRLLNASRVNGVLPGPHSPRYGQGPATAPR